MTEAVLPALSKGGNGASVCEKYLGVYLLHKVVHCVAGQFWRHFISGKTRTLAIRQHIT